MLLPWASHKGEAFLTALVTGGGEQCMVPPGVLREATPALESSKNPVLNSYKTQHPPPPCITLQFSNIKAGFANSVHNPVPALSNKHKNLSEQAGTDSRVKNRFY